MVDYSIDENFDIHFNEWDDFVVVDGLAEFEEDVVVQLHDNLEEVLANPGGRNTAREKIRLQVSRIAKQFGVIDSIKNISVERITDARSSFQVTVTYQTGDAFTEEL